MILSLTVAASLIVLALSGYAGWLLWRLHRQRQFQQRQEEGYQRRKKEHENYLVDSIRLIARSVLQDELNLSEGAIRLTYLLDALGLPESERAGFRALDRLCAEVKGFDTHEARQWLTRDERQRQDSEREAREVVHRESVLIEVRELAAREFDGFGDTGRRSQSF